MILNECRVNAREIAMPRQAYSMKILRSREIVIEYERVRLITKKAQTLVALCGECGAESDFAAIGDAAELFETEIGVLTSFVARHKCHFRTGDGMIYVCVPSLLEGMRRQSSEQLAAAPDES